MESCKWHLLKGMANGARGGGAYGLLIGVGAFLAEKQRFSEGMVLYRVYQHSIPDMGWYIYFRIDGMYTRACIF